MSEQMTDSTTDMGKDRVRNNEEPPKECDKKERTH
jgi:hypothetical protein